MDLGIGNAIISTRLDGLAAQNQEERFKGLLDEGDKEKLKEACRDFEAIFLGQMLKEMRKTVTDGGLTEKSHARTVYEDMFDEKVATNLAHSGRGTGLGETLYSQISRQTESFARPDPLKHRISIHKKKALIESYGR